MSFAKLATITASTKRPPAIANGKRGAATTNLSSIKVTPLDPVGSDTMARMGIGSPANWYECFAQAGLDIRAGDILTVSSADYPIRFVGAWAWPNRGTQTNTLHIVVEKVNP